METFQKLIRQKTGWSDAIVRFILTTEEADIYINAGLKEVTVNRKPALAQPHVGQWTESPWAELPWAQFREEENFSKLHCPDDYSNIDRNAFTKEKNTHWTARYKTWHKV